MPLPPEETPNAGARRGFHAPEPDHSSGGAFSSSGGPSSGDPGPSYWAPGPDTGLPAAGAQPRYSFGAGGTFGSPIHQSPADSPIDPALPGASPPPTAPRRAAPHATKPASTAESAAKSPAARPDRRFRGAITRTVAGTIIPGLGMLGTRMHNFGVLILVGLVLAVAGLWFTISRNPALIAGTALQSGWMRFIGVALGAAGLLWVAIIVGTYLVSRPRTMTQRQRAIGAVVVGAMSLLVSAPVAVASTYSLETSTLSQDVFTSEKNTQSQTRPSLKAKDPWADKATLNLLLLGGDSGEGRDAGLGIRTDTMMLASIDTKTGSTLIIQLPRNLQYPQFPAGSDLAKTFPYGFDNGSSSMLNAVWNDVPTMYPDLFADTDYAGADALKLAIEGVTALKVDYFVLVNIDGLVNLIDAMGGVKLNVNYPIAKGGSDEDYNCGELGFIPEGPDQLLNGGDAMWFARSRCNSPNADFSRMQRQSCLVNAVINQADPATMATRYEGIAQAASDMVSTDIPQEALSAMVELSSRVQKSGNVQRMAFVHGLDGYYSDYPDFDLMHYQIAQALEALTAPPAEPEPSAEPQPGQAEQGAAAPQGPGAPGVEPAPDVPATGQAENVTDACAYRHEEPLSGVPIPADVPIYTPPAVVPAESPR